MVEFCCGIDLGKKRDGLIHLNYSASVSAAAALGAAKDGLTAALTGLTRNTTAVHGADNYGPANFALAQNYPNPCNPTTHINYTVPRHGYISLKVYNLLGEEVATLFAGMQSAGTHMATFDGRGLASGVYLYQLQAAGFAETKRLLVSK